MELVDKINYRDELELARDLQASLIPRELPGGTAFELGAHNEIANTVGGDIYDFVPLSGGRLAVLFGDASGHGMAAGLVMAVAHAAFRTQLEVDPAPEAMFATLNRILCRTGSPRAFFGCIYLLFRRGRLLHGLGGRASARSAPRRRRHGAGACRQGRLSARDPAGALVAARGREAGADGDALPPFRRPRRGAQLRRRRIRRRRIEAALRRGIRLSAPALAADVAADLHAFCGRQDPEDDVSIAVIRMRQSAT